MAIRTSKDVYDDFISSQIREARQWKVQSNQNGPIANNPLNDNIKRNTDPSLSFLNDVYSDKEYLVSRGTEVDGKGKENRDSWNPSSDNYKFGGGSGREGKYNFRYGLEFLGDNGSSGHEDPTVLGFDIVINTATSPLFSGSQAPAKLSDFLEKFSDIKEIKVRDEMYKEFLGRIGMYFQKFGSTGEASIDGNKEIVNLLSHFKSHYIRNVSGLEKLVEKINPYGKSTQFVDYGVDKIELDLYEDVELSSGYLAMLYKTLMWSKINGKQLIPDNLLRFDMDIIISEVRNFKKVRDTLSDGTSFLPHTIEDNVSRYVYRLYECQFMFDDMSHQPDVDNWGASGVDSLANSQKLGIIYKFSTLDMEKIDFRKLKDDLRTNVTNRFSVSEIQDEDRGVVITDTVLSRNQEFRSSTFLKNRGSSAYNYNTEMSPKGVNNHTVDLPELEDKSALDKLKISAKKFAQRKVTRLVNDLVNDTIGKVRRAVGLRDISAPQNIYTDDPNTIKGFVKGQFQDFANNGINDLLDGDGSFSGGL